MKTLRESELCLLPWSDAHTPQTVVWLNDPAIQRDFGLVFPVTVEKHDSWRHQQTRMLAWAIELDAVHVGNLLVFVNDRHKSGYLQIYIGDPAMQGLGLGKRAMKLVLDHAFSTLLLHRIWLHTLPSNERAAKLYASLGFKQEGSEREAILSRGHVFTDQFRWSLLSHEWDSCRV